MEEFSDITGNPCVIQTFGATPTAMVKYLDFVGEVSDKPFMIDSTSAAAKIDGAKFVDEVGLGERAIYNSLNMSCEADEIQAVADSSIEASILLGFNPMQAGVQGKIEIWENGGGVIDEGVLEMAERCGITKPFMDVAITPLGQGAGPAVRTSFAVKSKWGYPVGSGIHNVPSAWDWLRSFRKPREDGKDIWHVCDVGSNFVQQMAGGDFVLFGPIENANMAFPGCAQTDIFIAEAAKDLGTEPIEEHPINKLL